MKRWQRGYTAVELMLALGLFAVGVSGIIAMQKVTIVSNQHAKNLAIATRIAEAWMDQLAADSTLWNATTGISSTLWVQGASGTTNGVWHVPAWDTNRDFGPAFDALGAPVQNAANARFFTHVRLTTLYAEEGGLINGRTVLADNGLARAEVRVVWLRDGATPIPDAFTNDADVIQAVADATDIYHRVVKVGAVRQHGSPK